MFVYYTIPNLAALNVRNEAAHGNTDKYTWETTLAWGLYGVAYAAVFLLLGVLVFRRRNF